MHTVLHRDSAPRTVAVKLLRSTWLDGCQVCAKNLVLHPSLQAPETAQPQQSMNQYEMDDYVLPRRRSPWVLVGAGGTAAILLGGLLAFKKGNQNLSQHMMRARVVAQGATVALMAGTAGVASLGASDETAQPAPQSKRKNQPEMQSEMQ